MRAYSRGFEAEEREVWMDLQVVSRAVGGVQVGMARWSAMRDRTSGGTWSSMLSGAWTGAPPVERGQQKRPVRPGSVGGSEGGRRRR